MANAAAGANYILSHAIIKEPIMVDREIIAATLAAAILNGRGIPYNEEGAKACVEFYRQMVTALHKSPGLTNEALVQISEEILSFASEGRRAWQRQSGSTSPE
jgi:hypothetical protein